MFYAQIFFVLVVGVQSSIEQLLVVADSLISVFLSIYSHICTSIISLAPSLFQDGILNPHAASCTCAACCDDMTLVSQEVLCVSCGSAVPPFPKFFSL